MGNCSDRSIPFATHPPFVALEIEARGDPYRDKLRTSITEQAVASRIGINHHTLRRWLSDNQSLKKGGGKLAPTALFLRRAGYL
jgi:hypothetical protein